MVTTENPQHLQFFAALFRMRSLRATARHFQVGHGVIKRAVQQLEDSFGQPLIQPGHPLIFTDLGTRLGHRLLDDHTYWQQLQTDLDQLRTTPTQIVIGIPSSEYSQTLYTHLAKLDQSNPDFCLQFVSDASMHQVESGAVHVALVIDRPAHQASIANQDVIGGIRIDIEHSLFEGRLNRDHRLLGGHTELEWEQLASQPFQDVAVECTPCIGPRLERDRSLLASLGQGVACLPTAYHAHDPTLQELAGIARFPLYSLHLVMHRAFRNSPAHQQVRQHLISILTEDTQVPASLSLSQSKRRGTRAPLQKRRASPQMHDIPPDRSGLIAQCPETASMPS